jgi:hypothetical protein
VRKRPALPTADDFFRMGAPPSQDTAARDDLEADEPLATSDREEAGPPQTPSTESRERISKPTPLSPPSDVSSTRRRSLGTPDRAASIAPVLTLPGLADGPLEKATLYLPHGLLKALEVIRVRLLTEYDIKINRSQIAEAVLAHALTDVEKLEQMLVERYNELSVVD